LKNFPGKAGRQVSRQIGIERASERAIHLTFTRLRASGSPSRNSEKKMSLGGIEDEPWADAMEASEQTTFPTEGKEDELSTEESIHDVRRLHHMIA
jgi:hypothetical protein